LVRVTSGETGEWAADGGQRTEVSLLFLIVMTSPLNDTT
jgi:hypothetical protein